MTRHDDHYNLSFSQKNSYYNDWISPTVHRIHLLSSTRVATILSISISVSELYHNLYLIHRKIFRNVRGKSTKNIQ